MTRLSTLDALGRGVANVRGNLEVVAISAAGTVGVVMVTVLALLPWFSVLGINPAWFLGARPEPADFQSWLELFAAPMQLISTLGWGFLALLIGLTAASFVFAWYYGGILGVLVAGDAQAPAGPGRDPELFRTFAPRYFAGEARRLL